MVPAATDESRDYDLIVIGAGVNGAGIACDAALRGLRVCLLEQADLCHGTSRWSSRLIHGGLRYLEHFEFGLVRESLHERERLLRNAPHLVKPLQLMIPVYRDGSRGRWTIAAGMMLYDLLSRGKSLPNHEMLSAAEALGRLPGLNAHGLTGAATYFDAQVTWAERLVVETTVAAAQAGATIRTYSHVDRILTRDRRVTGVRFSDLRNDRQTDLHAPVVVNAAGPWVDRVLSGLDCDMPRFMGGTKGTHIVTRRFAGAPDCACYAEAQSDGRPFFIIPWNELLLIGTTDIRFSGNPGLVTADPDELRYLVDETNHVFPAAGLTTRSVLFHYTGVRPLPRQDRGKEGEITRRHVIRHHRRQARGLFSAIGGKLTTYRSLAEYAVDRVCRHLGRRELRCATADRPLPGALLSGDEVAAQLERYPELTPQGRDRLAALYGARALEIAAQIPHAPELAKPFCPLSGALAAELTFALDKEYATTLADVLLRRCMVGLGADQGRSALPGALAAARQVLGWTVARADEEERRFVKEINRLSSVSNRVE